VESAPSSTRSPLENQVREEEEALQIESIARGMRILRWQLIFYLVLAGTGSFAFHTGYFADFPYAWFDAKETTITLEVIANENVHGSQLTGGYVDRHLAELVDEGRRGDLRSG
jgi:hypothetical protein